jgi:radical SAM protein with 4Fe4S-binding SPASM domain
MAFLVSARALPAYAAQCRRLFSWRRAWNLALVAASLVLSRVIRRPVVWGRPFLVMVEPTNLCNLKCPLCPSGNGQMTRPRGQLASEHFRALVDQVHGHAFLMMLWNQGEPFLNLRLDEMVRYAHEHRIFTFTSTNGHFIRTAERARAVVSSGLDEIVFSVDGVDQETYARYRVNGRLEQVLEGIRLLVQAKQELGSTTPRTSLQFIVMKHNERDLEAAERIARDLGVDKFLVKTAQVYTQDEAGTFLPDTPGLNRYEPGTGGELVVKGQPARGCKVLWYSIAVNWNGTVTPCCFDKDEEFAVGHAFGHHSLEQVWRGEFYDRFRQRVLKDRRAVSICTNCSEGYRGMFAAVKELIG